MAQRNSPDKKPRLHTTFHASTHPRWSLGVLEALADEDALKLERAMAQNQANVNVQVVAQSRGAAFDYAGTGFFDAKASMFATPLLEEVVHGDTAIMIALRQVSPMLLKPLLQAGADLELRNSRNENAISILWDTQVRLDELLKADKEGGGVKMEEGTPRDQKIRIHAEEYQAIFRSMEKRLKRYHAETKDFVKKEMERIYLKYNPSRVEKIDDQMKEYPGKEVQLLQLIKEKYDDAE